jgi:hypothetical protein
MAGAKKGLCLVTTRLFENKMLGRIFGTKREEGSGRVEKITQGVFL